ncbi:TetR/AcrR family transcriptional regulator [Massilia sp. 9I]|uniref:TetR/AcrR family transcriptional regulator n=1 Tax=Massilia sp. 9I TaxID=2653152 RepID=UPI0012F19017|nr:TetR/AcrR family transcriptional regulator [Massilia sp. 9I]VXC70141.1 Transcriptional regulator [Massilia sp. 9I]
MSRPRGRPAGAQGLSRDAILSAALDLLGEDGASLGMRSLAARMGVTPMSLYRHVGDHASLLQALSERVYGEVLEEVDDGADAPARVRALLTRYHDAVGRHPQLTLAIFAEPAALAGTAQRITERLTGLLAAITPEYLLWRDILVDHAHGSGLALCAARGDGAQLDTMRAQYQRALDCMLERLTGLAAGGPG